LIGMDTEDKRVLRLVCNVEILRVRLALSPHGSLLAVIDLLSDYNPRGIDLLGDCDCLKWKCIFRLPEGSSNKILQIRR
jgi:hypothetical protein